MNRHAEVEDYLKTIVKVGVVEEFFPASCTAIVRFPDEDNLKSRPLHVLHANAGETRDFHVLARGENVLCLFLPTGRESGFILGSLYRRPFTPAESDSHTRSVVFPDGTRLAYDWEAHLLTGDVKGKVELAATGDITLASSGSITIAASGALNLQSGSGGSWTGGGNISIGGD